MKYWFVMLMIAMSLMGCASTTKTETVTVVKSIYVEVPSEFTQACTATPPPDVKEYQQLSTYNKEYHLVMYTTALLQDIAVCSNRITKIAQWSKEQSAVFSNQNQEVSDAQTKQPDPGKR